MRRRKNEDTESELADARGERRNSLDEAEEDIFA